MTWLAIAGGLALGLVIGVLSGIIGIGGGAFLIPALIFFYGMSQKTAQGTSIATLLLPIGVFAFLTYWKAGHVDLKLAFLIALGFALGGWFGPLGATLVRFDAPQRVRRGAFAASDQALRWTLTIFALPRQTFEVRQFKSVAVSTETAPSG